MSSKYINLTKGWIRTDLENIATVILGRSPPSSTYNKEGRGLPFFQGKADFGEFHPTTRVWCDSPETTAKKNDILISVRAPVGSTNISTKKCCIGRGLSAIRTLDVADQLYVFYHLRYLENYLSFQGTGTTFKAITGKQLKSVKIFLPPLAEQHRIVAKIESIFAQIDAIRENLEMLALQTSSASRSLRQFKNSVLKQAFEGKLVPQDPKDEPAEAVLNRLHKDFAKNMEVEKKNLPLGWVKIPLAKIATINPKKPSLNTIGGDLEITFVPMKCVKELTGEVDLSTTRKYAEIRNGYTYFQNNDIIFAKITPCMENGKIAIMQNLKNKIGFGSTEFHVIRLIDNLGVRKFYFYYFIQDVFRNTAQHHMKGTAGQLRIPTHYLENVVVPFPPPTEQHRIVTKIESIFSKIDAKQKKIEKLEAQTKSIPDSISALKSSILKRAFEGRLVPQDPTDESAEILLNKIRSQNQKNKN